MHLEKIDSLEYPWFSRLHWLAYMAVVGGLLYVVSSAAIWFHMPHGARFYSAETAPDFFVSSASTWTLAILAITAVVHFFWVYEVPLTWRILPGSLLLVLRWWIVPLAAVALVGHMAQEGDLSRFLSEHVASAESGDARAGPLTQIIGDDLATLGAPLVPKGALLPGEEAQVPRGYDFQRSFEASLSIGWKVGIIALLTWVLLSALLLGLLVDSRNAMGGEELPPKGTLRSITLVGRTFDRE